MDRNWRNDDDFNYRDHNRGRYYNEERPYEGEDDREHGRGSYRSERPGREHGRERRDNRYDNTGNYDPYSEYERGGRSSYDQSRDEWERGRQGDPYGLSDRSWNPSSLVGPSNYGRRRNFIDPRDHYDNDRGNRSRQNDHTGRGSYREEDRYRDHDRGYGSYREQGPSGSNEYYGRGMRDERGREEERYHSRERRRKDDSDFDNGNAAPFTDPWL